MEKSFADSTGYKLDIKGNIQGKIFPSFVISIDDIALESEVNRNDFIIDAKKMTFNVKILSLFAGKVDFSRVVLKDFVITNQRTNEKLFEAIEISSELIPRRDSVRFNDISLVVNSGQYRGNLSFIFFGAYNEVSGMLSAESAHFKDTIGIPLSVSGFAHLKGKVDIKFEKLLLGDVSFEKTEVELITNEDTLSMKFTSTLSEGNLKGEYVFEDVTAIEGVKHLQLQLVNADATALLKQFNPDLEINNGRADFRFDGKTTGSTQKFFLTQMNGTGELELKDIDLLSHRVPTKSIMGAVFSSLSSLDQEQVKCFVANGELKNGRLQSNQKIGLETKSLVGIGSGEYDFETESIDFIMKLQHTSQDPQSTGQLGGMITAMGSLEKPDVRVSQDLMQGLTTNNGSAILDISSDGLSQMAKMFIKTLPTLKTPCEDIKRAE